MEGLPSPRLELEWKPISNDWEERECIYSLVIPLREHDIRREDNNKSELKIEIGRTTVKGGRYPVNNGKVDTPFRDGVHAMWDAKILNLPVWAVCDTYATNVLSLVEEIP